MRTADGSCPNTGGGGQTGNHGIGNTKAHITSRAEWKSRSHRMAGSYYRRIITTWMGRLNSIGGRVIRIETDGSYWFVDERDQSYVRTPKGEREREPGNWEEPEPGNPLHDLERHYLEAWCIVPTWEDTHTGEYPYWASHRARRYSPNAFPILVMHVGSGVVVSAPGAIEPTE